MNKQDKSWMNNYKEALIYYKNYGNLLIPHNYITESGVKLGVWINTQRQIKKADKMNFDRTYLLNLICMVWDVYEYEWNIMFNLLEKYYSYYGSVKMSKNFKTLDGINYDLNGYNLQVWLKCQRKLYNNTFKKEEERNKNYGTLTIEQIKKLESAGVDFSRCKVNRRVLEES